MTVDNGDTARGGTFGQHCFYAGDVDSHRHHRIRHAPSPSRGRDPFGKEVDTGEVPQGAIALAVTFNVTPPQPLQKAALLEGLDSRHR